MDADEFLSKLQKLTELLKQGKISEIDINLLIASTPTVDAVQVVHGRFELIEKAGVDYWRCSACQEIVADYYYKPKHNYCPNCGAKMDKEKID